MSEDTALLVTFTYDGDVPSDVHRTTGLRLGDVRHYTHQRDVTDVHRSTEGNRYTVITRDGENVYTSYICCPDGTKIARHLDAALTR